MNGWLEAATGLRLQDPWWLAALLLVPAVLWLRRRRGRPAVGFAPAALFGDEGLPRSWRVRAQPLVWSLPALGVVLMIVALARPVTRVQLPLQSEGIDILLCIDQSSSMAATDLDPQRSRLEVVKRAAADFVAGRPRDRIGLVGFARYPDLLCPLTLDHSALRRFLDELSLVEADSLEDRTGIGTAVARSVQALRHSIAESKVVILLTDGEENVATAEAPQEIGPLAAAQLAQDVGVRVYAIAAGVGKRDRAGQFVPLDTTLLGKLAERSGGALYEARDSEALAQVYRTIDGLERAEFEEPRYELIERFVSWLGLGLLLLVLGRALGASLLGVLP